jgi:hypothetical protein
MPRARRHRWYAVGRPQRKRGDLPHRQSAVERRRDDLPLADDRLFRVPADRLGLVVGPDAQREAELVGLAVAVGDHDVARRDLRHALADFDHLADGGVAGVDLAAARVGDVDRVRGRGVVDVVLGRRGDDAQPHVGRPDVAQLEIVELDDAGDVHVLRVATDTLTLAGDRVAADGVRTHGPRHGGGR